MTDKKSPSELCDSISSKLHRAEACLHAVTHELIPDLLKEMDECERKGWLKANRDMLAGLGQIYMAHAEMGDCRDSTFPDIVVQGGGT